MTIYILENGERYTAATTGILVKKMAKQGLFGQPIRPTEWMRQAAQRATEQTGARVRSTSTAVFVADLIASGLMKKKG